MNKKQFVANAVVGLLFLAGVGRASFADSPGLPFSYEVPVGGGKYIFVMLLQGEPR